MDYTAIMEHIRPEGNWSAGDTYEAIRSHSDRPIPSQAECEAVWKEIERDYLLRPVRAERDRLLAASDWTQIPDAPVDAIAWAKYRQALRDLPAKIKDPTAEVRWPEPPK